MHSIKLSAKQYIMQGLNIAMLIYSYVYEIDSQVCLCVYEETVDLNDVIHHSINTMHIQIQVTNDLFRTNWLTRASIYCIQLLT